MIKKLWYKIVIPWAFMYDCRTGKPSWTLWTLCLPEGWGKLFIQMCFDLRGKVKRNFKFSEVKEKYDNMRIYAFAATDEALNIISAYEAISENVCVSCGKPATKITSGWIESYCDDCYEKAFSQYSVKLKLTPWETKTKYTYEHRNADGTEYTVTYDYTDIWERYLNETKRTNKRNDKQ